MDSSSTCEVLHEDLQKQFFDEKNIEYDETVFVQNGAVTDPPNFNRFTASEVKTKLQKCSNSAPGRDRLTYSHLKGIDPDCRAMTHIFNICLKAKKIPAAWKISMTIFIPKEGDPKAAENWRPISLSCTLYKLFTRLIANRLSRWLENNSLFCHQQKGFRPFDGMLENNFLLQHRIREAKKNKKELYILLVDIKNAFGSIPHPIMLASLRAIGVEEDLIALIAIYSQLQTYLLTANGLSELVDIICGVKQGCALSAILFLLAIDPVIKYIQRSRIGCHVLSYADDMG